MMTQSIYDDELSKARNLYQQKQFTTALLHYNSLRDTPIQKQIIFQIFMANFQLEHYQQCQQIFTQLFSQNKQMMQIYNNIRRLYTGEQLQQIINKYMLLSVDCQINSETQFIFKYQKYIEKQQFIEAQIITKILQSQQPKNIFYFLLASKLARITINFRKAQSLLREGLILLRPKLSKKDQSKFYIQFGQIRFAEQQYNQALSLFVKAQQLDNQNYYIYLKKAQICSHIGKYYLIIKYISQALQYSEEKCQIYCKGVLIFQEIKYRKQSLNCLNQAKTINNLSQHVLEANIVILVNSFKYDQAIQQCQHFIKLYRNQVKPLFLLANIYSIQQNYIKKMSTIQEILQIQSKQKGLALLAECQLQLEQYDKAQQTYQLLLSRFPNKYQYYIQLSRVYPFNRKDFRLAKIQGIELMNSLINRGIQSKQILNKCYPIDYKQVTQDQFTTEYDKLNIRWSYSALISMLQLYYEIATDYCSLDITCNIAWSWKLNLFKLYQIAQHTLASTPRVKSLKNKIRKLLAQLPYWIQASWKNKLKL